ncbi:MAG: GntR family transcriptional regulator [Chloroflexota bacterium]
MTELTSPLSQINNKPLREQVLDALREAIVQGDLKPGQTLIEADLAAQLGISRAPIREALQILNSEGLLEIVPYRGTTVRRLSRQDIEELYSLRSVLEEFAMRRIIAHDNPDDIALLRAHYSKMLTAAEKGNLKELNELDRAFHATLIDLSRHNLLAVVWSMVALRIRQVMALLNMRNQDIKQIAYNHLPIIDALEDGDENRAVTLIKRHIAATGELIAEGWPQETAEDDR